MSQRAGISLRTLGSYISGSSSPQVETLERIAIAVGKDIIWFFSAVDEKSSLLSASDGTVMLPRYDVQASAGGGSLVLSHDVNDFFAVSKDWLSRYIANPARAGVLQARGDSMEPSIFNGDLLIVNFDIDRSAVDAGGIFVITVNDNLLVKRLQVLLDGNILVSSDNKHYQAETVDREFADDHMIVHAQVVLVVGQVRG